MMQRLICALTVLLCAVTLAPSPSAAGGPEGCLAVSGHAGELCLRQYTGAVEACRRGPDAACEEQAHGEGGILERRLQQSEPALRASCDEQSAQALGYLGEEDVVVRIPEACADFAEDLLDIDYADDLAVLEPRELDCQTLIARRLAYLRTAVVRAFGRDCYLRSFTGGLCDREQRDRRIALIRNRLQREIRRRCADEFDRLQLSTLGPDAGTADRIAEVLDRVVNRARHFAQRVYPPNDLGPTADFGPFLVGVRTLELVDPSRQAVDGSGSRPVTTEVYYPTTAAAAAGVPRDVVKVLGIPVIETPSYRDVALAPGRFPLVLFSHGNNGIRFQSFFFAAHLASHGFIVASPDHHGNTFVDTLAHIVDAQSATNRPIDMSFLIDQFLAFDADPSNFFHGAIDGNRIGMSGHSFGGFTTFALVGGSSAPGTFTDSRIKAALPQAPAAIFPDDFFSSITVPILIIGGSIDETAPFAENQQRPFDALPAGASIVGLAELTDAGHFTFSDFCEVPRMLLAFLGGFDEACEPRHLPCRHAHDIVNFLSLNFFDAALNGDPDAFERLAPDNLARIEDLVYQSK